MTDSHSTLYSFPSYSNPQPQPHGAYPYAPPYTSQPVNAGLQFAYSNQSQGSHVWGTDHVPPAGYQFPNAVQPLLEKPISFVGSNNLQIGDWRKPSLLKNARKRKPKPKNKLNKMSQSVRCEICDIYCNSIELYEKHLSGKKHLKTLQKKYAPSATSSHRNSQPVASSSPSGLIGFVRENSIQGAPSAPIGEGFSVKKQKLAECGCAADSVRVCTTCNVVCTSEKALADHLTGKRHRVKGMAVTIANGHGMEGASSVPVDEDLDASKQKLMERGVAEESTHTCTASNFVCNSDLALADDGSEIKNIVQVATTSTVGRHDHKGVSSVAVGEDLETKKMKLMQAGVAEGSVHVCTTCNIVCNSEVVFADHIAGKKHTAQVQKSAAGGGGSNPNQASPPTAKNSVEDIKAKRQKVEGSGTPSEAVRVCALCKVVCNSDVVFNCHLAGQKHASMVKKLAKTSMAGATASATSS